jgi:hypothetical protein
MRRWLAIFGKAALDFEPRQPRPLVLRFQKRPSRPFGALEVGCRHRRWNLERWLESQRLLAGFAGSHPFSKSRGKDGAPSISGYLKGRPPAVHARPGLLQPPAGILSSLNQEQELPLKNQRKLSEQPGPPQTEHGSPKYG